MTIDPLIYFGAPGNLFSIPHPVNGLRATRARPRSTMITVGGGARVGTLTGGKRAYTLDYRQLQVDTFERINAYDQGLQGPGPWVLLDPGQRNQLQANQAGATSETNGVDNFTISGSGHTIATSLLKVNATTRSLRWTSQFGAQAGTLTLNNLTACIEAGWFGIPVLSSRPYSFSFYARGDATLTDGIVNLTPTITWYDVSGVSTGTSSGSVVITNTSTWQQVFVSASPPGATTAFAVCSVSVTGASQSVNAGWFLDSFQFEEGAAPTSWAPGTGVYPVQFSAPTPDIWPYLAPTYRAGPVYTLQEVGQ